MAGLIKSSLLAVLGLTAKHLLSASQRGGADAWGIENERSSSVFIYYSACDSRSVTIILTPLIMSSAYDFMFKFIIVGDSSVGKSCLLLRFGEGRFKQEHEPTLGVQFGSRTLNLNSKSIKIQIWDTAGQESFKSITRSYYKSSIAAFLVYDITNADSFQSLRRWLLEVRGNAHEKVQVVVVGNKVDLEAQREVTREQGEQFAKENGFGYYETSAQSGEGVEELFSGVGTKVLDMLHKGEIPAETEGSYGIKRGKKKVQSPTKPAGGVRLGDEASRPVKSNCCW